VKCSDCTRKIFARPWGTDTKKYQDGGSPSFAQCYRLVQEASTDPAIDTQHLLRRQIFNVLADNSDGRGRLSEEASASFTRFFLETCLDQVKFMEDLLQPDRLRNRILLWVEEEILADALPAKAGRVLEAVLYRGELPRGEVESILGTSGRHARRVVATLAECEVLVSESPRAPWRLAFPARLAPRWMPGLFPEQIH